MTITHNSLGARVYSTLQPLAQGRSGIIDLCTYDPDFLIPEDVVKSMPDPLCKGVMFHATVGHDRVLAHFGVERNNLEASLTGLKILNTIVEEATLPEEEQTVYRATVTGDWHRLKVGGVKTLVLCVHDVKLHKYTKKDAEAPAFA